MQHQAQKLQNQTEAHMDEMQKDDIDGTVGGVSESNTKMLPRVKRRYLKRIAHL